MLRAFNTLCVNSSNDIMTKFYYTGVILFLSNGVITLIMYRDLCDVCVLFQTELLLPSACLLKCA